MTETQKTQVENEIKNAIASIENADQRAGAEIAFQFFTNADFRTKLSEFIYQQNS